MLVEAALYLFGGSWSLGTDEFPIVVSWPVNSCVRIGCFDSTTISAPPINVVASRG